MTDLLRQLLYSGLLPSPSSSRPSREEVFEWLELLLLRCSFTKKVKMNFNKEKFLVSLNEIKCYSTTSVQFLSAALKSPPGKLLDWFSNASTKNSLWPSSGSWNKLNKKIKTIQSSFFVIWNKYNSISWAQSYITLLTVRWQYRIAAIFMVVNAWICWLNKN